MRVLIDVPADDDGQITVKSFFRWLLRDQDVRRYASVSLTTSESAGEMGGLETINVLLTQGTGLLNLAIAFAAWRDSRARSSAVRVTIGDLSVTLSDETLEVAQRRLCTLLPEAVDDGGPEGTGA